MKTLLLILITIILSLSAVAQKTIQPYVKLKSGEVLEFVKVKKSIFTTGNLVGTDENGKKTKFKSQNIHSALIGKREVYDNLLHKQILYLILKRDKLLSVNGKVLPGTKWYNVYTVIISNGINMILQIKSTVGNADPYSNNSTITKLDYYYVKGDTFTQIFETDLIKPELIDDMINDFGKCEGVEAYLKEFKTKEAKMFRSLPFYATLKEFYYKSCLVL